MRLNVDRPRFVFLNTLRICIIRDIYIFNMTLIRHNIKLSCPLIKPETYIYMQATAVRNTPGVMDCSQVSTNHDKISNNVKYYDLLCHTFTPSELGICHCDQKRRHLMTLSNINFLSALLALCEGDPTVTGGFPPRSPVDSSHRGQWRRALIFSLMCARTNGLANSQDPGDLSLWATMALSVMRV